MSDIFILGDLIGGSNFGPRDISCSFRFIIGQGWRHVAGAATGETQTARASEGGLAAWSHPIDLQVIAPSVDGWPVLVVEVYRRAATGVAVAGYGMATLPRTSGAHDIEISTWIPVQGTRGRLQATFFGTGEPLPSLSAVIDPQERAKLEMTASGVVHARINILVAKPSVLGIDVR